MALSQQQPVTTFVAPSSGSTKPLSSSGPLQVSPSNGEDVGRENAGSKIGGQNKDRHSSPAPLGPADSNVTPPQTVASSATVAATKAVKRTAAAAGTGAEKRKKALKRL